jgi:hypothetical protein
MREIGAQFYRHTWISEHIIKIKDMIGMKAFLITGARRAALIDAARRL